MDFTRPLCEAIAKKITDSPERRITFAEYMDAALYHPSYGYYSTKAVNLGKEGDFFTSVHLCADFGELLAVQFVEMWEILGHPKPFTLVEMGAGQGILASDILNYINQHHQDFFAALEYLIVEKSPTLSKEQQQRLLDFPVRWCNLEEIPTNSIVGCFFSNELVDALPVHQFVLNSGKLQEIYVTLSEEGEWGVGSGEWGKQEEEETNVNLENLSPQSLLSPHSPLPTPHSPFTSVTGEPSTSQLVEYFDNVGIKLDSNYPDGYRSEVNLAAQDWLKTIADRLQQGYVLTIDYGYSATRYYNPRKTNGTLQCYYQHRRHDNPYIYIGQQDITAHVNFTALERWGDRGGLAKVGFSDQSLFLMALGLGGRIANLSNEKLTVSEIISRRDALHQLIDPYGVGSFGVLVQSKALTKDQQSRSLKGFTIPEPLNLS